MQNIFKRAPDCIAAIRRALMFIPLLVRPLRSGERYS